jgi:predicted GIY-YIG superfamily endonuclease
VFYVYLIGSLSSNEQRYVGVTSDLERRLQEHNAGKSSHTAKFKPWRLITYVAFSDRAKADSFERYLKSGSGHAFANKRLWYGHSINSSVSRNSSVPRTSCQWLPILPHSPRYLMRLQTGSVR